MKKQLLVINLTVCLLLTASLLAFSQEPSSTIGKITNFPSRYFEKLQKNYAEMEEKLIEHSSKGLKKLARQEARLKKKLAGKDFLSAEQVFGNVEEKYRQMQAQLEKPELLVDGYGEYIPHFDSLKTSFNFLSVNPDLLPGGKEQMGHLQLALNDVKSLEGKLNRTEQIKKYLRKRKRQLHDQLGKFGFSKELNKFSKEAYYYS